MKTLAICGETHKSDDCRERGAVMLSSYLGNKDKTVLVFNFKLLSEVII